MDDTEGLHPYGSRLLKDMGWSRGKGLGKNEDGMKEPLKVKKKFNTKGIGFNGVDDKWIEHQETYEDILSKLNSGAAPEKGSPKLTSIEQRSRSLRGRIHYSKFLRGKDLSQKKEEDLKAIVINRKKAKTCSDDDGRNNVKHEHSDDTMHPLTYTSNISYQEYFAQRMKHKREAAAYTTGSSEVANAERVGLAPKEKGSEERHDSGKKQKERRKESKRQSTEIPSDARPLQEGEDSTETGTTTVAMKEATKVKEEARLSKGKGPVEQQDAGVKHETCRERKLAPDADGTKRKVAKRKNVVESETVVKRARTKAKNETTSSESKVEGERQDAEAERQTYADENCSVNNNERAEAQSSNPVLESGHLHCGRQIVYSSNVKQERFKLRPRRYLYYLTRDLRTVYRNANLKDIPGYASEEWMKQCTMLVARSLHGVTAEGKSQCDV
ncbi:PIN2/TERF1-interacting telomerase inhibitor 1-like [Ornithodoros turicata]|uniref:PIN2/TERF1-interacting telomerase inhibitor 1-like n=1 Tax=Ornithodoros turicata TaxID=34597 RepID=UPI0031391C90